MSDDWLEGDPFGKYLSIHGHYSWENDDECSLCWSTIPLVVEADA